ncbi:LysR family transcriptional regulator [Jannaschia faecimaris]|nr:LysR family transcriptional regulator [Jannaschia faecimaris]
MSWDDLRTVLMLVRHQSLAGAAHRLGVNYTTVARRIRRAEMSANQVLFERLTDGYRPTEAARLIAEHAEEMETSERAMARHLLGADSELAGDLTITAPPLLIANFLTPVLSDFTKAFPRVSLRILATNKRLNLSRMEADLAIRASSEPGDTLTGLRLCRQERASFANFDLAKKITANPEAPINWIVYSARPDVPDTISPEFPNNRVHMCFDDMVAMIGAAQAGLGVVRMPVFLGRTSAGLVQVPVLKPQNYEDIWVVGHPDVWPSRKLRAFRELLVMHFKKNQSNFIC